MNRLMEHTSQGLSQSLHDKGFRGEHKDRWVRYPACLSIKGADSWRMDLYPRQARVDVAEYLPAYTFTELWGVLPEKIEGIGYKILRACWAVEGDSDARYMRANKTYASFTHESPAEALGLLLEWLIDNGHYKVVKGE